MRKLVPKKKVHPERYPEDVTIIVQACQDNHCEISRSDAVIIWEAYSDDLCASWMIVDRRAPEEIFDICRQYGRFEDGPEDDYDDSSDYVHW